MINTRLGPVYVGKSRYCVRRRMLSGSHPARKHWQHRGTTCAIWWPNESPLEDFERALILACPTFGIDDRHLNRQRFAPRFYAHWEDPVLVDILRPEDALEGPGVYAILPSTYSHQFSDFVTQHVEEVQGSAPLREYWRAE